jgi:hypothetical protein
LHALAESSVELLSIAVKAMVAGWNEHETLWFLGDREQSVGLVKRHKFVVTGLNHPQGERRHFRQVVGDPECRHVRLLHQGHEVVPPVPAKHVLISQAEHDQAGKRLLIAISGSAQHSQGRPR